MPRESFLRDVHGIEYTLPTSLFMKNSVVAGHFEKDRFVVKSIVTSYQGYYLEDFEEFTPDDVKDRDAVFAELLQNLNRKYRVEVIDLNGVRYGTDPNTIIALLTE